MVTQEAVHLTAVAAFSIAVILALILFYDLWKYLHQINSNNIRNTAIVCILSFMTVSVFFVIWHSVEYVILVAEEENQHIVQLNKIILEIRRTSGIVNFIAVAYFITITLDDVYKGTFLSINTRLIYICYIIYVVTIISWHFMLSFNYVFSHWYPPFANETSQMVLVTTTMIYSLASEMYFIFILILFNVKLFKFISLTKKNNEELSLEINNRFQNFIVKQTNIISIMIIAFIIFQIIAYLRWVSSVKDPLVNLLYQILFCIHESSWAICIYLTFKFNNKYYKMCCKYSHFCCIYSCTKLTEYKSQRHVIYPQYLSVKVSMASLPSPTRYNKSVDDIEMTDINVHCIIDKCTKWQQIFDILSQYKDGDQYFDEQQIIDVLNAFDHLLTAHDSENDFNIIYETLNANDLSNCNYENCKIYSRHYSRRRRRSIVDVDDHKETAFDDDRKDYSMADILDKLHSFYYHSYDTFTRIKASQKFVNEDSRIAYIHKIIKGRKNSDLKLTNKFNSDLKFRDNINDDNIYSFGERFEYEHKSSKWFVDSKYETLKSELIDNQICNITFDEYLIEHSKCLQYMKTNCVKMMIQLNDEQGINKNLSIHHILSLLVYCNCDEYQRKWSETFRQIPSTESDESLKNRHSHFYYCSKYLRELIEYFGKSLILENENKTFYHGVNQLLYFTRTITKFNAPLSTSTEPTVALNFSGHVGVVLALKFSSATYLLHAKYFDCSFFSEFINEKECLFLGGVPMMIITNIINVSNGEMYRKYINALNIINCVLGGMMDTDTNNNKSNYDFTDDAIELCCSLLLYQLSKIKYRNDNLDDNELSEYIVNLLNRYCVGLKGIMIFWDHMEMVEKLKNLLCDNKKDAAFFELNIVSKLFPNVEQIEIFIKSSKRKIKATVQHIINNISSDKYVQTRCNLKYIVIHYKGSLSPLSYKKNDSNEGWNVFQNDSKVIICKQCNKINFKLLNFRFNQLNQANASKRMLKNLF